VIISNISIIMPGKTTLEAIKIISHKSREYTSKKGELVQFHELILQLGSTVFLMRADKTQNWDTKVGEEVDLIVEITTFGTDLAPTFTAVGMK